MPYAHACCVQTICASSSCATCLTCHSQISTRWRPSQHCMHDTAIHQMVAKPEHCMHHTIIVMLFTTCPFAPCVPFALCNIAVAHHKRMCNHHMLNLQYHMLNTQYHMDISWLCRLARCSEMACWRTSISSESETTLNRQARRFIIHCYMLVHDMLPALFCT